jgi:hypothetical protein
LWKGKEMTKTITIEKEVYEAVLRNSVKVADLEAENMQLRQFCEGFNTLEVSAENQRLKSLLKDLRELIGNNFLNHKMRVLLTEIDEVLK